MQCNVFNTKLDGNNFDEEHPEKLFMLDLQLGRIDLNKTKHVKKDISKELMSVACNQTRWQKWCMSENEKKEIESLSIDKKQCEVVASGHYQQLLIL